MRIFYLKLLLFFGGITRLSNRSKK